MALVLPRLIGMVAISVTISIAILLKFNGAVAGETQIKSVAHPQCWTREQLSAKPGEHRVLRKRHAYQPPAIKPTLAEFAPVPHELRGSIRRVDLPADKRWIALTLDYCEQPHEIAGYDGRIIDLLRDWNVPATLFLGGKWMQTHGNRTEQLMSDPLFELANHSEAHRNLRHLHGRALSREITGPQQAYEALRRSYTAKTCVANSTAHHAPPPRLTMFRFPYGACNTHALDAVNDAGLLAIQWDFSAWDSSLTQSAARIAKRMVTEVKPGSIILAHGNGRGYHTYEALRRAIPKLRAKGFKFVTVGEMLKAGKPVIADRCYNFRPGDTDRYGPRQQSRPKKNRQSKATPFWPTWNP